MANKEDVYVVGILEAYDDRTEIKFVTSVNMHTKYAEWKDGEKAMEFSGEYAKDLSLGLCMNGYIAIPMLKAEYLNLGNPKAESEK